MIKKFFGFTIGEVLIALGVIGIIAMLTIPQIINGRQATEAKSAFNTAYSIISNTITEMDANNVSIRPESYDTALDFLNEIVKYQKVAKKCISNVGAGSICYLSTNYKNLDGANMDIITTSRSYVLNNGMLIAIKKGTTKNGENISTPILIAVDINGKMNPPNRMGFDFFIFELTSDEGLMPSGGDATTYKTATSGTPSDSDCNITALTGSGATCAARALAEESYFTTIYKNH